MRLRPIWSLWSVSLIVSCTSIVSGSTVCKKSGPCACERPDGSVLDLLPAVQGDKPHFFDITMRRSIGNSTAFQIDTYLFHPCSDAKYTTDEPGVINKCNSSAVCHRNIVVTPNKPGINDTSINATIKDSGYEMMSTNDGCRFIPSEKGSARLLYTLNAITVSVDLICVESTKTHNLVLSEYDSQSVTMTFYSPNACFTAPSNQHSFGTTLLIIFFVMALTYLIAGCCVKHFLMGARGVEVIPNYNFWRELPDLVRDGITFIQNGFKPPARTPTPTGQNPNPNSYDSI